MDAVLEHLVRSLDSQGGMLRRTIDTLSAEEFSHAHGETAPPAGWHLWHVVRWADRLQSALSGEAARSEIWTQGRLAEASGLSPEDLGVLQLGMGMEAAKAQSLPSAIGKQRFASYLGAVLDALQEAVAGIDPQTLLAARLSIREYAIVDGIARYAPAQESTLFADLLFHLSHSSRHLGNVEALKGLRGV